MNYSHKLPSSKAKLHSMDSEKMTKWLRVVGDRDYLAITQGQPEA